MKIEDRLAKMKKVYEGVTVSDETVVKEWQLLEKMLGEQQYSYATPLFFRAFAFLVICLILSGGIVSLAQAAKPGEMLYPVKKFSQEVVKGITKTFPVFVSETPAPTITEKNEQPTVTVTPHVSDEDHLKQDDQGYNVKGIKDEKKEYNDEEKENGKKPNDVKGNFSEYKEEEVTPGNDENRNSGFDNRGGNRGSTQQEKENSSASGKVSKNNSETQEAHNKK